MGALAYLLGAIVVSAIATMILVARNRRPQSMDAGMREFRRGLEALDPANDPHQRATGSRPAPTRAAGVRRPVPSDPALDRVADRVADRADRAEQAGDDAAPNVRPTGGGGPG